jgi:hypothetical protein
LSLRELLTAQSLVRSVPDWPEPAIVQFGSDDECRDMMFGCWLFVCSKTSTSPVAGQTPVPTNQNAGQVPHLQISQRNALIGYVEYHHSHVRR